MDAFAYFPSIVYRDERPEWVDYAKQVVQKHYDAAPQNGVLLQTNQMASDPDLKFLVDYLLEFCVVKATMLISMSFLFLPCGGKT